LNRLAERVVGVVFSDIIIIGFKIPHFIININQ
jgi:hypothetical protein